MQNKTLPLRPASAAIAAVLALSSTALIAQDIVAPPTLPAPAPAPSLIVTPSTPSAPAPVIVLPPVAVEPAPAPVAATAPVRAEPRAISTARRASAPAARVAPARTSVAARTEPVAIAPAQPAPIESAAPAAIELAPVQADAAPPSAAPQAAAAPVSNGQDIGELGLIGGALAIGGIAAAALLARRRRHGIAPEPFEMPVSDSAPPVPLAPRARVAEEPAVRYATQPTPLTPRRAAMTDTAAGRHVRAAEAGPTPENPFLTRANRMRRARFLDAQEARAMTEQGYAAQRQNRAAGR